MRHLNIKWLPHGDKSLSLPRERKAQSTTYEWERRVGPGSAHRRTSDLSIVFTNLGHFSQWPPLPHNSIFSRAWAVSRERGANPFWTTCGLVPHCFSQGGSASNHQLQNVHRNWLLQLDITEKAHNGKMQSTNNSSCLFSLHFSLKITLMKLKYDFPRRSKNHMDIYKR